MAHSLPHNLMNLGHSQITTAHRPLSIYVHIVFMKFLCKLQRFIPFVIYLKPDTKRCKPHGAPSIWPLKDREFYMSFTLADSHSYPGKIILTKRFPSGTPGTCQHRTTQHNGTEIFKVPLDSGWQRYFTRSVRGLNEICTKSEFCKARQQGKAAGQGSRDFFYSSLLCSTPL